MIVKLFLTNVFADGLFSGGKAAVAILRHLGQEVFLQALAEEMALPVTAYVLPRQDRFVVRYFTPEKEVESADYASLAAACALLNVGLTPPSKPVRLQGLGGVVSILPGRDSLAMALKRPVPGRLQPGQERILADSLGLGAADVLAVQTVEPDSVLICCRSQDILQRLTASEVAAAGSEPRKRLVFSAPLTADGVKGYVLRDFTASGEEGPPLNLAPHAVLAPFWAERLGGGPLEVHRLSRRNALMWAELHGESVVHVSGKAQIIFKADPVMDELTGNLLPDLFF